jgi:hypothetical protein
MSACFERNKEAYIQIGGYPAIAITSNRAIAPNIGRAPNSYVKYDPFINAYILSSSTPLSPVPQNEERALDANAWLAPIASNGQMKIGRLIGLGDGLGNFGKLSVDAPKGTIITGGCCDMYGIGIGNDRFIGNRYLEHIVAYDTVYYGDVGASFVWRDGKVLVENIDPFSGSGLRIGDKITHIEGRAVKTLRDVNEAILFAPKGSSLAVKISRANQTRELNLEIKSRPIVAMSTLSYLEPLGMHFDSKLVLQKVDAGSKAHTQGLESGDKLMQIGNVTLDSPSSLRAFLPTLQRGKTHHMLFERRGFQFFITLELPNL